ncbi:MAG: right-handed parallel beta-helix repeat-containing protein [Pseudomonadota bacterium]|nr:right-handed parallel beta-helix repeat-containing protein [Pseudomonadota bacterium]
MIIRAFLALVIFSCALPAFAAQYYVAPQASADGDGSSARPFDSVKSAIQSGVLAGGDRLILAPGSYDAITLLSDFNFSPPVVIGPARAHTAHTPQIFVRQGDGLTFYGINVWPEKANLAPDNLLETFSGATNIRFENLEVRGKPNANESYFSWSAEDWVTRWRHNGALLRGAKNSVVNSRFRGVAFGITIEGPDGLVTGNTISGFSGDGMRTLGDNGLFENNQIENCFKVDGNHDDGIQSWARHEGADGRKVVRGVKIVRNRIYEWRGPEPHPLRCSLQGVGLFDGIFNNFLIKDNLVAVTHYHGISLYGGDSSQIVGNTVVNLRGEQADRPWIKIDSKKTGPGNRNNLVIGNVAPKYEGIPAASRLNLLLQQPGREFVAPLLQDFRVRADSRLHQMKHYRPNAWVNSNQ